MIELRDYVTTEDGQGYENGDGSYFDDGVMALAIAITVHNLEAPVPAYSAEDTPPGTAPRFKVVASPQVQSGTGDLPGAGKTSEKVAGNSQPVNQPTTHPANQEGAQGAETAPWDDWDDDE
jgi:hypothetical protein